MRKSVAVARALPSTGAAGANFRSGERGIHLQAVEKVLSSRADNGVTKESDLSAKPNAQFLPGQKRPAFKWARIRRPGRSARLWRP